MDSKLKLLLSKCKCGGCLQFNSHRDYYQTAEDWILEKESHEDDSFEVTQEVRSKMIETDTIVSICFSPHTPVGSYSVHHYDLGLAIDEALSCLTPESME
jgi:hypothetical protein